MYNICYIEAQMHCLVEAFFFVVVVECDLFPFMQKFTAMKFLINKPVT